MNVTFENVNYTYYTEELGRSLIPNETEFNNLKFLNVELMKSWLPYVIEREPGDIDKAVCMMMETEYKDNLLLSGKSADAITSESVLGHTVSIGSTSKTKLEELNAKSTEAKKLNMAKVFLYFSIGVK